MADVIEILTTATEVVEVAATGPQGPPGPTGPTGPTGTTDWNDLTNKPTAFNPTAHAATHADGGSDSIQPFAGVQLDVANPDATPSVGQFVWNDADGVANVLLKGGNVTLPIGQATTHRVYNGTAADFSIGQVVYLSGSQGQRVSAELADNGSEATAGRTFGIVAEAISKNADGFIVSEGVLSGVNTQGMADGAVLYLGTNGAYTTTNPTSPLHSVVLGVVIKGGLNENGSIFVKIINGPDLDDLHNVLITSPTAGQFLYRNTANTLWINKAIVSDDVTDATASSTPNTIVKRSAGGTANFTSIDVTELYALSDIYEGGSSPANLLSNKYGKQEFVVACSDETTALTTGTAKVTFRMPNAMTLTAVRASVTTAPVGSTLIVDINEGGTSVLGTKLSIDANETTSTTATSAPTITDSTLADDAEITIDIDQIGSTTAGAGLKVALIGKRA